MPTLLILLGLVAAAAAASPPKLLLADKARHNSGEPEKREFNFFQFDPNEGELKVEFKVCVQGDKSEVPCHPVTGHVVQVFDKDDVMVFTQFEKYLSTMEDRTSLAPYITYKLQLAPAQYKLRACVVTELGLLSDCNEAVFYAGLQAYSFGRKRQLRLSQTQILSHKQKQLLKQNLGQKQMFSQQQDQRQLLKQKLGQKQMLSQEQDQRQLLKRLGQKQMLTQKQDQSQRQLLKQKLGQKQMLGQEQDQSKRQLLKKLGQKQMLTQKQDQGQKQMLRQEQEQDQSQRQLLKRKSVLDEFSFGW